METELARTMDEKAENGPRPFQEFSADEQRLGADTFWWAARSLFRRRWFIIIATVLAGIGSIAISLILPVWYKAETRVLLPESGRWKEKHREQKRTVLGMGFKRFIDNFMRMPCQIIRSGRRTVFRLLSWNPWLAVFFRLTDVLRC